MISEQAVCKCQQKYTICLAPPESSGQRQFAKMNWHLLASLLIQDNHFKWNCVHVSTNYAIDKHLHGHHILILRLELFILYKYL